MVADAPLRLAVSTIRQKFTSVFSSILLFVCLFIYISKLNRTIDMLASTRIAKIKPRRFRYSAHNSPKPYTLKDSTDNTPHVH